MLHWLFHRMSDSDIKISGREKGAQKQPRTNVLFATHTHTHSFRTAGWDGCTMAHVCGGNEFYFVILVVSRLGGFFFLLFYFTEQYCYSLWCCGLNIKVNSCFSWGKHFIDKRLVVKIIFPFAQPIRRSADIVGFKYTTRVYNNVDFVHFFQDFRWNLATKNKFYSIKLTTPRNCCHQVSTAVGE